MGVKRWLDKMGIKLNSSKNKGDDVLSNKLDMQHIFEQGIANLSQKEIKNQILQILNYEDNFTYGCEPLMTLLSNCNMVLKKYNTDKDPESKRTFEKTLDDIVNMDHMSEESYKQHLNDLNVNDDKSFVLGILNAKGHIFSTVIYKKYDEKYGNYFEAVVVNKAIARDELHSTHERYRISVQNIDELVSILGYYESPTMETEEIYEKLKELTIDNNYEILEDIVSREQIVGNCYYKELEAGLKYAYSNAYNGFEVREIEGRIFKIPKWPVKTSEFNSELIVNIKRVINKLPMSKEDKAYMNKYIDDNILRYLKSKYIKDSLSDLGSTTLSDEDNNSALMRETMREHDEKKVELLLESGVSPNVCDEFGATPLMHETKYGHNKEIVKILLGWGADVNVQDNDGYTALINETVNGHHKEIVKMLLVGGADVNHQTKNGWTALMNETVGGHSKGIISMLLQNGADVNLQNNEGWTALMYEIVRGHSKKIIEMLIKHGANVNLQNENGCTALMYEIINENNEEIIEMMLNKGAKVDLQNSDGWTALLYETRYGHNKEVTKMLLDKGADVNSQTKNGWTALMHEIRYGRNKDIIKMLLDKGADVNLKTKDGWTPLMLEIKCGGSPEIIKMLLDKGANINLKNKSGWNAITMAKKYANDSKDDIIFELIKKYRNKPIIHVRDKNNIGTKHHNKGRGMEL